MDFGAVAGAVVDGAALAEGLGVAAEAPMTLPPDRAAPITPPTSIEPATAAPARATRNLFTGCSSLEFVRGWPGEFRTVFRCCATNLKLGLGLTVSLA